MFNKVVLFKILSVTMVMTANPFIQKISAQELINYVGQAMKNSSIQEEIKSSVEAMQALKEKEGLWENPTVGVEYGRVKNTGITGSLVGATVEQSLPINGSKSLARKKIDYQLKKFQVSSLWKKEEYKTYVISLFLQLWIEREKISHAEHRKDNLELLKKYLANQKFSSPQQKTDAYLIKKKIEELNYELRKNHYRVKELENVLATLSGQEIKNFDVNLKGNDQIKRHFESIMNNFSSIEKFREFEKKQNELSLTQQERKWIPELSLGYSYQKENVPGGNLGHAIGLNFSIPIFDSGHSGAQEVKAQMRVQEAKWRLEDLKRKSQFSLLKERLEFLLALTTGKLEEEEKRHEKDLKRIKDYFLKGLISAQGYLDTEELGHVIHYRQVNAKKEILEVFIEASSYSGKIFRLEEVLL